jgi:hypothetical protein
MSPNPTGCAVAAILLLLGAKLVIDPGALDELGANFIGVIRNFNHEIRGVRWRDPWRQMQRLQPIPLGSSKTSGRLLGAAFIVAGLLIAAVS